MMEFTKMHGLGNDFIILDGRVLPPNTDCATLARKLCHRQMGIGSDGIALILSSQTADVRMRIINSDGSEPAMCGNLCRCFAKYLYEKGMIAKERFAIETLAGLIRPKLTVAAGKVTAVKVDMGKPNLQRREIPMNGPVSRVVNEALWSSHSKFHITSLLMNVPHTMIFVSDVASVDLSNLGPQIEKHPSFPKGTNVNFVEVLNENEIKVRTWERGAGATLACGTGCCASVVAAVLNRKTGRRVTVHLAAGDLFIEWAEDQNVYMTGPAEEVCSGEISPELLQKVMKTADSPQIQIAV
jgi:diaminopimelate epimerase